MLWVILVAYAPWQCEERGLRFLRNINTNALLWAARSLLGVSKSEEKLSAEKSSPGSSLGIQIGLVTKESSERTTGASRCFCFTFPPSYLPTTPARTLERAKAGLEILRREHWGSESPLTLKGHQRWQQGADVAFLQSHAQQLPAKGGRDTNHTPRLLAGPGRGMARMVPHLYMTRALSEGILQSNRMAATWPWASWPRPGRPWSTVCMAQEKKRERAPPLQRAAPSLGRDCQGKDHTVLLTED